jgi:hypothetical protein
MQTNIALLVDEKYNEIEEALGYIFFNFIGASKVKNGYVELKINNVRSYPFSQFIPNEVYNIPKIFSYINEYGVPGESQKEYEEFHFFRRAFQKGISKYLDIPKTKVNKIFNLYALRNFSMEIYEDEVIFVFPASIKKTLAPFTIKVLTLMFLNNNYYHYQRKEFYEDILNRYDSGEVNLSDEEYFNYENYLNRAYFYEEKLNKIKQGIDKYIEKNKEKKFRTYRY